MKALKKLDVAALSQELFIDKTTKYETLLGALVNITIGIVSIIFFIIFGLDLIEKKNPISSVSKQYIEYPEFEFNKIFFRFDEGPNMPLKEVTRKIYPILRIVSRENHNITISIFEFVDCENVTWFKNNYMNVLNNTERGSQHFCLNDDMKSKLKGKRNTPNATEFEIKLLHCSENPNGKNCYNYTDIVEMHRIIIMALYYSDTYIDSNDYDEPIKNYWNTELLAFGLTNTGIAEIILNAIDFFSDKNLILSNHELTQSYQTLKNKFDTVAALPNLYGMVFFNFSNIKDVYKRRYLKFQDVLANTGGFIKLISMIILFVYKKFVTPFMNQDYLKRFLKKYEKLNNSNKYDIKLISRYY